MNKICRITLLVLLVTMTSCSKMPNDPKPTFSAGVATNSASNYCLPLQDVGIPIGDGIIDSHILFSSWNSKDNEEVKIWAVSMKDGNAKLILDSSPSLPLALAFLKDQNHFIIVGGSSVWLSDMSGSPLQEFTSAEQFIADFRPYTPIWDLLTEINKIPEASDKELGILNSPDGRFAAIWTARNSALSIRNRQTSEEIRIIETEGLDTVYGNWSPDGSQFAFSYYRNDDGQGGGYYSEVFSVNADGTEFKSLTERFERVLLGSPRWSPDGQKVMLTYDSQLEKSLLILDLKIKSETLVKISPYWRIPLLKESDFIWSPDSKWIAYISVSGHYGIEAINTDDQKVYCITDNDQYTTIDAMDWR